MTAELLVRILAGACFALILFLLRDIRQTVRNHWMKIEKLDDRLDGLSERVAGLEVYIKKLLRLNGIGDGDGKL